MSKTEQAQKVLGFAQRARKLLVGMNAAESAIRSGRARVVIIASDTSRNTESKIRELASMRHIPVFRCGTKDELGQLLGRKEVGIIGIADKNFANSIRQILE